GAAGARAARGVLPDREPRRAQGDVAVDHGSARGDLGAHASTMNAPVDSENTAPRQARRDPLRVLHLRDSPWLDGPGRTILETAAHVDPTRVDFRIGALVSDDAVHPLLAAARARGLKAIAIADRGGKPLRLVDE